MIKKKRRKNVSIARQHEAGNKGAALSATLAATLATFATFVVTYSQAALTQPPSPLPSPHSPLPLLGCLWLNNFYISCKSCDFFQELVASLPTLPISYSLSLSLYLLLPLSLSFLPPFSGCFLLALYARHSQSIWLMRT